MINSTILRQKALRAHKEGDYQTAEALYRTLIDKNPEINEIINLGSLLRSAGKIDEGEKYYRKWINSFPNSAILRMNAANFFCELGQNLEAEEILKPLLSSREWAKNKEIKACYARVLIGKKKYKQALKIFQALLENEPQSIDNLMNAGVCLSQLNRNEEALGMYDKAQIIDQGNLKITGNRIILLRLLERTKEARNVLNSVDNEAKNDIAILNAEAALEHKERNYKDSSRIFGMLCQLQQLNVSHWINLAASLKGQRKVFTSHRSIKRGIKIDPTNEELQQALAQSYVERGQQQQATFIIKNYIKSIDTHRIPNLFQLQFMCSSYHLLPEAMLQKIARDWEKSKASKREIMGRSKELKGKNNKIKAGYFSSDFCNHPVGRFITGVIKNHNLAEFEIYLLDTGSKKDKINNKLATLCSELIDLSNKSSKEIDDEIRSLELDILIELGGYSNFSRLDALIDKPAPIQLSYLGYPAPTYLKAIDGWIGDDIVFSKLGYINQNAHKLHKINGGYMAYSDIENFPPINQEATSKRRFRFGSFNHNRKITKSTIDLWVKLMKECPYSQLVLKSVNFKEESECFRVKNQFIKAGLEDERLIIFHETKTQSDHLQLYSEIDIALDPIPYSGATTTFDALMMGVPVITLSGKEMIGQLSSSILYYAGLENWIAKNQDEYIDIAKTAYCSGVRNYHARQKIRLDLSKSEIINCSRLSKKLEELYKDLIEDRHS